MFEKIRKKGFQIRALHHAEAILKHVMPDAAEEIEAVLLDVSVPIEELVRGGGGEGLVTQRIRRSFSGNHKWKKHVFEIKKIVDGEQKESVSREIDHVKVFPGGTIALEIEWNNKDPFYDRDLENFKRLHAEGAISIGGLITRGKSLQDALQDYLEEFAVKHDIDSVEKLLPYYTPTPRQAGLYEKAAKIKGSFAKGWAYVFFKDKYGQSTTHWRKLEDRMNRGVGNPCPLLLIGLPKEVISL